MAESVIFAGKGCAYKITLDDSSNKGFWEIKPEIQAKAPILYRSSEIAENDAFAKALAFNDLRVIAPTTKNFSSISLGGIALLGYRAQNSFIKDIRDWFNKNRARTKNDTISVSAQKEAFKVLLEGLRIGSVDPQFHIITFDIRGYIIDD